MSDRILQSIHARLRYMHTMGIEAVPRVPPASLVAEPTTTDATTSTSEMPMPPTLDAVRTELGDCQRCKLCATRTNIVFGVGNPHADLMFIGEGPGADEDQQGEPFVGRAGKLLNKIIAAMALQREDVYIGNIVKCRPPENRNPQPDEVAACIPFLKKQIQAIQPKVVVCLGSVAVRMLFGDDKIKITQARGTFREWEGIRVMPTYHPAFLLRNPNMKKPVWDDMQQVMTALATS